MLSTESTQSQKNAMIKENHNDERGNRESRVWSCSLKNESVLPFLTIFNLLWSKWYFRNIILYLWLRDLCHTLYNTYIYMIFICWEWFNPVNKNIEKRNSVNLFILPTGDTSTILYSYSKNSIHLLPLEVINVSRIYAPILTIWQKTISKVS